MWRLNSCWLPGLLLSALFLLISSGQLLAEEDSIWQRARRDNARVISYDPRTDTFLHQESVLAHIPRERPGGEEAYYGDLRTALKFLGPDRKGGIYTAIRWYYERLETDIEDYRYRFRY